MNLLHILGLDMESGETIEEFTHRAEKVTPTELLGFIPSYEEYLYKGTVPGQEDVECMHKANIELRAHINTLGIKKRLRLFWTMF